MSPTCMRAHCLWGKMLKNPAGITTPQVALFSQVHAYIPSPASLLVFIHFGGTKSTQMQRWVSFLFLPPERAAGTLFGLLGQLKASPFPKEGQGPLKAVWSKPILKKDTHCISLLPHYLQLKSVMLILGANRMDPWEPTRLRPGLCSSLAAVFWFSQETLKNSHQVSRISSLSIWGWVGNVQCSQGHGSAEAPRAIWLHDMTSCKNMWMVHNILEQLPALAGKAY